MSGLPSFFFSSTAALAEQDTKTVPAVDDPLKTGKKVADKKANLPFYVHQKWLAEQAEKERLEAEAKAKKEGGGKPGRAYDNVRDANQSLSPSSFFRTALKTVVIGLLCFFFGGYFVTGSFTWGYEGKWTNYHTYLPTPVRHFTPAELALYNGRDPSKPLYLAIKSEVYDVTAGRRHYGPGGSYSVFAGKDASRAFVTGCFRTGATHDLRGLTESELASVEGWRRFFANHAKYFRVGTVHYPPIDPDAPIPEKCASHGG